MRSRLRGWPSGPVVGQQLTTVACVTVSGTGGLTLLPRRAAIGFDSSLESKAHRLLRPRLRGTTRTFLIERDALNRRATTAQTLLDDIVQYKSTELRRSESPANDAMRTRLCNRRPFLLLHVTPLRRHRY
ncbi:hypothetical protein EVAR_72551_1 [Eumeta japonica]|uniref:Uncharacterized protein n=1 Tax=Eumeta variegata TaxID=151549 RepID=A0A4C1SDY5_EUMVA|nr:hypothetical protein EVAR_72551_1 [Eumeta japonica]